MSLGRTETLRTERGQTLVMFVLILSGIVLLLAFVVDVGGWIATKHRLQNVADAAALSAVQSGAIGPQIDDGWATLQPQVTSPDSVTVTATHDAPIIFGGLAGITGFTQTVTATAEARPATSFQNIGDPRQAPSPDGAQSPYVVPLIVNECVFGIGPPNCSVLQCSASDPSCSLTLGSNPALSQLGAADVSCTGGSCPPPRFRQWMTCGPCNGQQINVGDSFGQLTGGRVTGNATRNRLNSMLNPVPGQPAPSLLLPVFEWDTSSPPSHYTIVGFARFVIASVDWANQTISGNFTNYVVQSSHTTPGAVLDDFGVRAIGLTD